MICILRKENEKNAHDTDCVTVHVQASTQLMTKMSDFDYEVVKVDRMEMASNTDSDSRDSEQYVFADFFDLIVFLVEAKTDKILNRKLRAKC